MIAVKEGMLECSVAKVMLTDNIVVGLVNKYSTVFMKDKFSITF